MTTIESWPEGRSIPSIGWFWTGRDGTFHIVRFPVTGNDWDGAREETRSKARAYGYPGHQGGRWNYFVADLHEWLARKGWTRCKCHANTLT